MIDKISLIITTYNWPEALERVLQSVRLQIKLPDEVIIADDGSGVPTRTLINNQKDSFPCRLKHVWQVDQGNRGAKIRNLAVKVSTGNYVVFIDGDCLLRPDYIQQQKRLAEAGYFIAGNRVLISAAYTHDILINALDITAQKTFAFTPGQLNRRWALLRLPLGILRKTNTHEWKGAKTCNLSLFKSDFLEVNGLDQSFTGWGHEDSDLVIRLINYGVKRLSGRFALTVFHLWHPNIKPIGDNTNWDKLVETMNSNKSIARNGISRL